MSAASLSNSTSGGYPADPKRASGVFRLFGKVSVENVERLYLSRWVEIKRQIDELLTPCFASAT